MSFEKLKKNRKAMISSLLAEAEKSSGGGERSYGDDRYWKPTVDKSGNGYAVIRFLPSPNENQVPWAQYWDHGFKGPTGRWYIERSLTSIGQPDPVSELNSYLWNTGKDEDKDLARARKRRLHYVSNIYVVSDSNAPQNEGKVFLFQYGKKIFSKIMDVMQPSFEDETPINPFDFWEGANFKLKIRQVEGYRNYDKSEFAEAGPLLKDEEELKKIYDSLHSLSEFSDPAQYKSYEVLSRKLHEVLGDASFGDKARDNVVREAPEPAPTKKAKIEEEDSPFDNDASESVFNEDEGFDMGFFEKLAQD